MRLFLLAIILCACSIVRDRGERARAWFEAHDRLRVVATTSMVADLARAVGGDRVAVWTLIGPGHDPHSYELVKGDGDFLERADLILFSGLGLEHGASMQGVRDQALVVGDRLLGSPAIIYDEGGALDPHIWMDISLWAEGLDPIAERLSALEPSSSNIFRARAAKAKKELLELHKAIRQQLMALPSSRRYLVTAHDAFRYFTRAYLSDGDDWQSRLAAAEGLAPHGQVSLADLQGVAAFIRDHKVATIFPESYLSRAFLKKLLKGLDVRSEVSSVGLCADTMLEEADFDYAASMRHNANTIHEALK